MTGNAQQPISSGDKTRTTICPCASGCIGFFSGVESFSREQISAFNKKQNRRQEDLIRSCLEAGA